MLSEHEWRRAEVLIHRAVRAALLEAREELSKKNEAWEKEMNSEVLHTGLIKNKRMD